MTRIYRSSAVFAALAMLSSSAAFAQVNFAYDWNVQEPEEVEGWDGDAIRIVFDEVGNSQQGVSFDSAVTGDYSKLEFDFELRFLNDPDTPEGVADGIGWTYANVDIFGESAEDDVFPNYSGEEPNLEGSIGVGFDTWMNAAIDDESGESTDGTLPNSFSLHYDGQRLVTLPMSEYDLPDDWLETPSVKRAHIEIVPGEDEALVTVQVTDTESGESVTAFEEEPIDFFEPYDGRMTFRARTGGEWADSDLDNISVTLVEPDGTRRDPVVHYGRHVGPGGEVTPGDYNDDGALDVVDLNLQSAEMKKVEGQDLAKFDHNTDGKVDVSDRTIWVKDLKMTWVGDANFDREFNSGDLVTVFAAGKYETGQMADWTEGDWDGDMAFGSGDLVYAFSDGGYEMGAPPAVAAVPEPSSLALVLIGLFAFGWHRRYTIAASC